MNIENKFDLKNKLVSDFQRFESQLNGESKLPIHAVRTKAMNDFNGMKFPTKKNEEWKYTDPKLIINKEFNSYSSSLLNQEIDIEDCLPENIVAEHIMVFINGEWSQINSKGFENNDGWKVESFRKAITNKSATIDKHFSKYTNTADNVFSAINTAFANDGLFVEIEKNTVVDNPIVCVFLADPTQGNVGANPRNLIIVGENAQASIIELYLSVDGEGKSLTNVVTEVVADQNAQLDYYKIQHEADDAYNVNITQVKQEKNSNVSTNFFSFGGALVRNELNFLLNGEHIESYLNGLYMTNGTQHIDNRSLVDHAKPNCMSDEFYKGIMGGVSKAVFNGKIMVRPDAQKTNAFQSNKNILVSDTATINTKPQLEIFADDVRCTHGATTGQLNEEALFYMQARGISKEVAKKILLKSFAADVVERIKMESLKEPLIRLIEEKLAEM